MPRLSTAAATTSTTDDQHPTETLLPSERAAHGLLEVTEEQKRTYIAVAYALRFNEPSESDETEFVQQLANEVNSTKATIRSIFKGLREGKNLVDVIPRKAGSGRKKSLEPDNPGLVAAALAINDGVSQRSATVICNTTNKRLKVNCDEITRPTLMSLIHGYSMNE